MKKKNTRLLAILFAAITLQGAQGMLIDGKKIEEQLNHFDEVKNDKEAKEIGVNISKVLKGYPGLLANLSKEIDEEKDEKKKISLKKDKIKEVRETNVILIEKREQLNKKLEEYKALLKKQTTKTGKKNTRHDISVLESIKKQLNNSIRLGEQFMSPHGFVKSMGHRVKDFFKGKSSKAVAKDKSPEEVKEHLESEISKYRNRPESMKKEFMAACAYHPSVVHEVLNDLFTEAKTHKFVESQGVISAKSFNKLVSFCPSYLEGKDEAAVAANMKVVFEALDAQEEAEAKKKYNGWLKKGKALVSSKVEKSLMGLNRSLRADANRLIKKLEGIVESKKWDGSSKEAFELLKKMVHVERHLKVVGELRPNDKWIHEAEEKLFSKDNLINKVIELMVTDIAKKKSS